jgi:ATP-dependent RNA helicase DDX56/DBP9
MKRKLDANDIPSVVASEDSAIATVSKTLNFTDLGLDSRLLQAIVHQKYAVPTPVQVKAIPLALQGKDIIARAKTGSGKTAAYLLPLLQQVLRRQEVSRYAYSVSTI